jgi:hypothetical protein
VLMDRGGKTGNLGLMIKPIRINSIERTRGN